MKLTKLAAIALISTALGTTSVLAQTRAGDVPAEFPPASYKGKQYVDSSGCVFIRAGIDGNVSWIPRVTRKRTGVCGFKPTFAGQVSAPTPVEAAASTQITIATPAPAAAAAPAPQVRASQPRPAPVVKVAAAPKPAPKPRVIRQVAKAPAPVAPAPIVERAASLDRQGQTACPGASLLGQRYLQRGDMEVRCGPQDAPIVGARISSAPAPRSGYASASATAPVAAAAVQVAPDTRIVPRHVAVNRVNTANVTVPKGYKRVWEDGRLNPKRAEQSLAGHRAMALVWTSTVPRRLINQADGKDVTASVPLVYPYVDYATQQAQLGQVTLIERDGQILKRIVRNVTGLFTPKPRQAKVATVQRAPVVYSSRSSASTTARNAPQARAEVAGAGFVQVGSFADAAAAQRMARDVQRMGMPVRIGRYTRDGQTMRLVIAGPFGADQGVSRAVSRLQRAGYNGAFAR